MDGLDNLLGNSVILCHEQLREGFESLSQASVGEDVADSRLQIVLAEALSDLWLLIHTELIVCEDEVDEVACLCLHLGARLAIALAICSCMQIGLSDLVDQSIVSLEQLKVLL